MAPIRERIMEAMLELVAERGYEAVSLEQVLTAAGVDRDAFEGVFASKEECAIAVTEAVASSNLKAVREGYESEETWPDSLRAAAYTLARWITEHPREVRFGIVEMLWADELTRAVREEAFRQYIEMVDGGREVAPHPEAIPEFAAEGIIGSITEMLAKRLQRKEQPNPYEFIPELMYLAVLPYLGEEAARRELTMPAPERLREAR